VTVLIPARVSLKTRVHTFFACLEGPGSGRAGPRSRSRSASSRPSRRRSGQARPSFNNTCRAGFAALKTTSKKKTLLLCAVFALLLQCSQYLFFPRGEWPDAPGPGSIGHYEWSEGSDWTEDWEYDDADPRCLSAGTERVASDLQQCCPA